jgi:DNA-binding Lrp family transcriptional regulator
MLDHIDTRLLAELQRDSQLTSQDLGEALGLSPSQVGRRRQRLEASGLIRRYSAQLDAGKLGLAVQAFIQVELAHQRPEEARSFSRLLDTRAEVVSAWILTGATDYLLRVYCKDLSALNHLIHEVLLRHEAVAKVQSQIVMDQRKTDAPLPL